MKKDISTILVFLGLVLCVGYFSLYGKPDFLTNEETVIVQDNTEHIHCMICNRDLTNYGNKIWPHENGYYCTSCYEQTMKSASTENSYSDETNTGSEDLGNSGYTTGSDGRVYENAPCSLCGGTGIEKAVNSLGSDRVCPQCEGRGHQSY